MAGNGRADGRSQLRCGHVDSSSPRPRPSACLGRGSSRGCHPSPYFGRSRVLEMTESGISDDFATLLGACVRALWALVQRWDLTLFLQGIRARGERPGRAATDPQLLIALWLYTTIEGNGCGRQLNRLCIESDPYKWLCGGVSLNYHT